MAASSIRTPRKPLTFDVDENATCIGGALRDAFSQQSLLSGPARRTGIVRVIHSFGLNSLRRTPVFHVSILLATMMGQCQSTRPHCASSKAAHTNWFGIEGAIDIGLLPWSGAIATNRYLAKSRRDRDWDWPGTPPSQYDPTSATTTFRILPDAFGGGACKLHTMGSSSSRSLRQHVAPERDH